MNISDYLTYAEAAEIIGTNVRGIYRLVARAEESGYEGVSVRVLGKRVIPKGKIDVLRSCYFPFGSEARRELARECGKFGMAVRWAGKKKK